MGLIKSTVLKIDFNTAALCTTKNSTSFSCPINDIERTNEVWFYNPLTLIQLVLEIAKFDIVLGMALALVSASAFSVNMGARNTITAPAIAKNTTYIITLF